jgi:hypothetical protein
VRTSGAPGDVFAVAGFLVGAEEVRGVEAESAGVVDADLVEPVGDFGGGQSARVPAIDIHRGGGVTREGVDGVADQAVALVALAA